MLHLNFTSDSIKRFKFPILNRSRIIKFFKEVYELDDEPSGHRSSEKNSDRESFPSVGKKM